jgi:hypothetical protein
MSDLHVVYSYTCHRKVIVFPGKEHHDKCHIGFQKIFDPNQTNPKSGTMATRNFGTISPEKLA